MSTRNEALPELRLKFLRTVLRPLVRFCLRGSIVLQAFVDELKVAYVEIGEEEMRKTTRKVNVSRLSVMTGVHRKDVTRIFKDKEPIERRTSPILSRVIGQWEQDARFTTKKGAPRILSNDGDESPFRELVRAVSTNINPGTIAFELERIGAVEKTARGLRLVQELHRVGDEPERRFEHLSRNVSFLIQAGEENLFNEKETRNINLRTEYDNVFLADVPAIRSWLLEETVKFHKRVRDHLSKYDKDVDPQRDETAGVRVVLGSYSFSTEHELEDE